MSQQKILLTVCLVAGFAAAVYSQGPSVNPGQCAQNLMAAYNTLGQTLMQTYIKAGQQAGQLSNGAFDVNKFTTQVTALGNTVGQMGDISNGINPNQIAQQGAQAFTQYMAIGTTFMNPQLGIDGMSIYADLMQKTTGAYSDFASALMKACVSGN